MKTLYLIRHAKSDWGAPNGDDHERPLNKRGVKAARTMGRFLAAVDQVPEAILSSSAVRARATVELMAEAGGWGDVPVRTTRALYESGAGDVLEEIRAEPETTASLLVAGHEPTWSDLAGALTGGSRVRMVTAALVRVDCGATTWKEVAFDTGALIWMVTPKLLQAAGWPAAGG